MDLKDKWRNLTNLYKKVPRDARVDRILLKYGGCEGIVEQEEEARRIAGTPRRTPRQQAAAAEAEEYNEEGAWRGRSVWKWWELQPCRQPVCAPHLLPGI